MMVVAWMAGAAVIHGILMLLFHPGATAEDEDE